jgi:hypothetical protein
MTNKEGLILKDEIKVNDTYKNMYTVNTHGEMNEYENVRFISTLHSADVIQVHFVYNQDQKGHSFIVGNTLAFVSKLEALRVSSSMLAEIYTDALYLYLEEKSKQNG